jgi:hypothetical protein
VQIVETTIRPARFAVCIGCSATPRTVRRAFRFLGGRWGGTFDLLLRIDPNEPLDEFNVAALRRGDPDFIVSVGPGVTDAAMRSLAGRADVMPLALGAMTPSTEQAFHSWLVPSTVTVEDEAPLVYDPTAADPSWHAAVVFGLPTRSDEIRLTRARPDGEAAILRTAAHLAAPISATRWLLLGDDSDIELAAKYWTLRALGGRPAWRPTSWLADEGRSEDFPAAQRVIVYAPGARRNTVEAAARRWGSQTSEVVVYSGDPEDEFPEKTYPVFTRHAIPVLPHQERLRFSTPSPRVLSAPLRPGARVVAHHRVLSPDAGDPDGLILGRDPVSAALAVPGSVLGRRPTRDGFAEVVPLAETTLIDLPLVHYTAAVSAPFESAGFTVAPSDKGVYQQRVLHLAGGLLFLAWILRNRNSGHLLDLFFEYPREGKAPTGYRRAVRYDELEDRLLSQLRGSRTRLREPARTEALDWL